MTTKQAITSTSQDSHLTVWQLPKLLWAGMTLFSINLIIGVGVGVSPELNVTMYGEHAWNASAAQAKPTAFAEAPSDKPRSVRAAQRLTPIIEAPGAPLEAMLTDAEAPGAPLEAMLTDAPTRTVAVMSYQPTAVSYRLYP